MIAPCNVEYSGYSLEFISLLSTKCISCLRSYLLSPLFYFCTDNSQAHNSHNRWFLAGNFIKKIDFTLSLQSRCAGPSVGDNVSGNRLAPRPFLSEPVILSSILLASLSHLGTDGRRRSPQPDWAAWQWYYSSVTSDRRRNVSFTDMNFML